ncbi:hypothetical protein PUNSTDRAFT_48018 [Punctularia strigosozonata HHB-11173 SS5]|uniref:Uncharacterized protein n=1 Tax=Punctularia strigosozonata (strain HHB-11173) TaxID=741275 RepID=R7RZY6_PUNST|nr:uncharacterized protein PUNSTDRAFT_48018 [Punctularia strigosozonata HHB-11173 SS5]EIN03548.1 hypothetical protein PUNSTDRAFT_48018 [Punctularia strigosozonata HHB-11173 SS5]
MHQNSRVRKTLLAGLGHGRPSGPSTRPRNHQRSFAVSFAGPSSPPTPIAGSEEDTLSNSSSRSISTAKRAPPKSKIVHHSKDADTTQRLPPNQRHAQSIARAARSMHTMRQPTGTSGLHTICEEPEPASPSPAIQTSFDIFDIPAHLGASPLSLHRLASRRQHHHQHTPAAPSPLSQHSSSSLSPATPSCRVGVGLGLILDSHIANSPLRPSPTHAHHAHARSLGSTSTSASVSPAAGLGIYVNAGEHDMSHSLASHSRTLFDGPSGSKPRILYTG